MFEEALGSKPLAPLLERLSSRLGESAVLCPQLEADAQPEYSWRKRKSGSCLSVAYGCLAAQQKERQLCAAALSRLI